MASSEVNLGDVFEDIFEQGFVSRAASFLPDSAETRRRKLLDGRMMSDQEILTDLGVRYRRRVEGRFWKRNFRYIIPPVYSLIAFIQSLHARTS